MMAAAESITAVARRNPPLLICTWRTSDAESTAKTRPTKAEQCRDSKALR